VHEGENDRATTAKKRKKVANLQQQNSRPADLSEGNKHVRHEMLYQENNEEQKT